MYPESIHINGVDYGHAEVLDKLTSGIPEWQKKGWSFISQLLDPHFTSFVFHTSGTTGRPKDIFFTRDQILYSARNTCRYFNLNSGSSFLLCLPADFVAGRMMIARAFVAGAKLVWVEPVLQPDLQTPVDFAAFTPAQISKLTNEIATSQRFGLIPKVIIGGGEVNETLEKKLHPFHNEIFMTYGMTETLTHVAVRKMGEHTFQAVYPEVRFTVNQQDCLCIELPFISDRPIETHDMVHLLSNSSFIWKGRLDNVINSGGLKLHPEELEKRIIEEGLLETGTFYISSQQDETFGQIPVIVMLKEGAVDDMATLLNRVNGLLNKHEAVKHIIILDKFEYTDSGKIKRSRF